MAEKIDLNSVDKFDPQSDPSNLAQSNEHWFRSFELSATWKRVTDDAQKFSIATLCRHGCAKHLF